MNINLRRLAGAATLVVIEALALMALMWILPGLQIERLLSAIVVIILMPLVQSAIWFVFIQVGARLHPILYPIITFILVGVFVYLLGEILPGFSVDGFGTAIWVAIGLTVIVTVVGVLISTEEENWFDYNVTQKMVERYGQPTKTDEPGFLFLEIDGLAAKIFRRALNEGYMPTLKSWLESGTHKLVDWETDMSAQTAAMQSGILHGNNSEVPAYRWYDRQRGKVVISGVPTDTKAIEHSLSNGRGLLSDGGASRGNMFSGDASESLFTFSTMLDRGRGASPGFYLFLLSPFVITRTLTLYVVEMVREVKEAWQQRWRDDQPRIGRHFPYHFMRGFMVSTMSELAVYTTIADVLRGVPAVYSLFPGYDDLAHFAGIDRPEVFKVLYRTDRYFARILRVLDHAPRPYHVVVLSDHGQSQGFTFKAKYDLTLEDLVKQLIRRETGIYASLESNEAWDSINAVLTDTLNSDTRTARLIRRAFKRKIGEDGQIAIGPERDLEHLTKEETKAKEAEVIVMGSGPAGLIYIKSAKERMTLEQLSDNYPGLVRGLADHPGIGFVLVRSEEQGDMAMGAKGIHFLDDGTVEGEDPLADYGPNAARHLKRESGFSNVPDIVVNTAYDPQTDQMCGFETQVGHHGGLGGAQNHPFLMYPSSLPLAEEPIIGAESVYRILRGWRNQAQNGNAAS